MQGNRLIFEGFLRNIKDTPDKVALLDTKRIFTYSELYKKACQVAATLSELNLENKHVFILGNKSAESMIAILGALFAGFTYVALDINQPAARLDHIFSLLQPQAVIVTPLNPLLCRELKQMKAFPQYLINLSGSEVKDIYPNSRWVTVGEQSMSPLTYADEQIAYILFTSGSTGQSKGVCISHRAALTAIHMFKKHIGPTSEDIIANQAALCFDLSVFDIFVTLNTGSTLSIIPPEVTSLPDRFFQRIEEQKATSLFTTPSTIDFLLTNKVHTQSNFFLKRILLSGEPVSSHLLKKIYSFCVDEIEIWNLYGATEVPYILAHRLTKKLDALGNAFSLRGEGIELKLRKSASSGLEEGRGELLVKGPTLLSGYINKNSEELASPLFEKEWYATGDLAAIEDKGQVTLHGRIDRQIKIHGHRVELDEIEFQLANCPEIQEVATVFVKEQQEIMAYIVLCPYHDTEPEILERIKNFCEKKLPLIFLPSKFVFIDSMPYTASGKKDRKALISSEGER